MAWIDGLEIEHKPDIARAQPSHVIARIKVFAAADHNEERVIQIDAFGSADRQNPGKQSQTLQFDQKVAEQLFDLLRDVYGFR